MKRHNTDLVSLIFGLLFAAVAATWVFPGLPPFGLPAGLLLVIALVVIGGLVLVSIFRRRPEGEPGAAHQADAVDSPDAVDSLDEPESAAEATTVLTPTADARPLTDPDRD